MESESNNNLSFPENEIREIPIDQIEPDPEQIRKEFDEDVLEALAESIKDGTLVQPILVTTGKDGKYQIVDGERRWRAHNILAENAKSQEGPVAMTIRAMYVAKDIQLAGILGNVARESYNPLETATALAAIKRMLGENARDGDVANCIGKSRSLVSEYNSLLRLPQKIQDKAITDSCVPFLNLKRLATGKGTDEEKIEKYETLHNRYSAKKKGQREKAKDHIPQSRATRTVIAVCKKVAVINAALSDIQFDKVEDKEKKVLLESLGKTQELIEALLQEHSE